MRSFAAIGLLLLAAESGAQTAQTGGTSSQGVTPRVVEGTRVELAGQSLLRYPHFQVVRAFHEGSPVEMAIDPSIHPGLVGLTGDVYVVVARTLGEWAANPGLIDVTGGPQTLTISGASIQANTLVIDTGTLSGDAGTDLGVGYDVVVDFDLDGTLGQGDLIDGLDAEAGFYVVRDTTQMGPLAVKEITYSGGSFLGQNTFYPTNIASLGQLPLIVVSHGNGHQYTWYDHIGRHLASYGYIVMSHQNNTVPGSDAASITTLTNTDYILNNQGTIDGGALAGHIDADRIVFVGHSRGGEGVIRAYARLLLDQYVSPNFDEDDVVFISSMAPVTHISSSLSFPDDVNFQLLYGAADADVSGSPSSGSSKPLAFYERAFGNKHCSYAQGVGHAWWHNGATGCTCTGPDLVAKADAHDYELGLLLPLVKLYVDGNVPALDFFERMDEDFRPLGLVGSVITSNDYRQAEALGSFVIDDFQTQTSTPVSSSGGAVVFDVLNVVEGLMRDQDGSFLFSAGVPMNGMTRYDDSGDSGRAVVFDWTSPGTWFYEQGIIPAERDLSDDAFLSFRACQGTRHPETDALDAPLALTVTLRDTSGVESSILTANYGAIERPYKRAGSGAGVGWANEFSTVRLRLTDFLTNGSGLDLSSIEALRFELGGTLGSARGRLALDDIEIIRE
ncbi:MAG: hypothetical protein O7B99_08365 [Planctomycetota bacterium]|nr:hypothetical protein [Planctomycetota bacterium]